MISTWFGMVEFKLLFSSPQGQDLLIRLSLWKKEVTIFTITITQLILYNNKKLILYSMYLI